ncbi:MAG: hypothetical protein H6953_11470 [Chromatiaceae bacterium]|nr:hypothetical protein [Chromatiaceae bacterium]MCP5316031.1 hypothetical protein [Chromatiaceae bacterium]
MTDVMQHGNYSSLTEVWRAYHEGRIPRPRYERGRRYWLSGDFKRFADAKRAHRVAEQQRRAEQMRTEDLKRRDAARKPLEAAFEDEPENKETPGPKTGRFPLASQPPTSRDPQ